MAVSARDIYTRCNFASIVLDENERAARGMLNAEIPALCASMPRSLQSRSMIFVQQAYARASIHNLHRFFDAFYAPAWTPLVALARHEADLQDALSVQAMAMFLHRFDDHLVDGDLQLDHLSLQLRTTVYGRFESAATRLCESCGYDKRQLDVDHYFAAITSTDGETLPELRERFAGEMALWMIAPSALAHSRGADAVARVRRANHAFGFAWRMLDDVRDIVEDARRGQRTTVYAVLNEDLRETWQACRGLSDDESIFAKLAPVLAEAVPFLLEAVVADLESAAREIADVEPRIAAQYRRLSAPCAEHLRFLHAYRLLVPVVENLQLRPACSEDALDWSDVERDRPLGCAEPSGSAAVASEEIVHLLRTAGNAVPIVVRGAGHSCGGQTLASDALQLRTMTAGSVFVHRNEGTVRVPGGATWKSIVTSLVPHRRRIPVLPDFLHLTAAGTVSVGGIGVDSLRYGFQADQIVEATLLTPAGRLVLSRDERPDVFRLVGGGLGQCGYIESLLCRTIDDRPVSVHSRAVANVRELGATLLRLSADESVHHANGWWTRGGGGNAVCEYGAYDSSLQQEISGASPRLYAGGTQMASALHDRRERWLAHFPKHVRLWVDYVFDGDGFLAFLEELERVAARPPLQTHLSVAYLLPIQRPAHATDFAFVPIPESVRNGRHRSCYSVGLYLLVPRGDILGVTQCVAALQALFAVARSLGGRPYLYGWNQLNPKIARELYGEDLDRLAELRRELGLEHVNARVMFG